MGRFFALLLLVALSAAHAVAQQDQKTLHVLIEPAFMHPEVSFPIPLATRTVLVPGYLSGGDPQYFSKKDWDSTGYTWDAFRARAATSSNPTRRSVPVTENAPSAKSMSALTR